MLREGSSDADIPTRLVKVRHTVEQLEDELNTIVDLGGTVQNVMVNPRAYGKLTADLALRSRSGIARYLDDIRTGKSTPLMTLRADGHDIVATNRG